METSHMGPPSTKERVGNVDEVNPRKIQRKLNCGENSHAYIFIGDKTRKAIMLEMGGTM